MSCGSSVYRLSIPNLGVQRTTQSERSGRLDASQPTSRNLSVVAEHLIEDRALQAIAMTRTRGMHPLGHFVGISGRPSPTGTVRLTLSAMQDSEGGQAGAVPLLAFCVFADLVVGSAIRSHIGPGARLGTVMLSLQHRRVNVHGDVRGSGYAPPPQNAYGTAHAVCTIGDEVVGHAQASAAALPAPPGRTPPLLPWERDVLPEVPELTRADLRPDEAQFLTNVQAASARAAVSGSSVQDELLDFVWEPEAPDGDCGVLTIGPELSNRVGHIQGGVLYAAGARAAGRTLGEGRWELAEGSYQFHRPAEGRSLAARTTVLRRGRSTAFVQVHLSVDTVSVGTGLFVFRARE
jgi:acyl-coenzyme A thioesterase PaaI-like protein